MFLPYYTNNGVGWQRKEEKGLKNCMFQKILQVFFVRSAEKTGKSAKLPAKFLSVFCACDRIIGNTKKACPLHAAFLRRRNTYEEALGFDDGRHHGAVPGCLRRRGE
ncbi:hypothetical protein [uncultured Subdoligranulum sp.]|uniref:hypothetical protein n=1 Tax=uncultured Subdoligranulum sp. TaxID=512298 RepID=UPI002617C44A|nr:hypothetical protein [uncultured Subdoligranulum sp.]